MSRERVDRADVGLRSERGPILLARRTGLAGGTAVLARGGRAGARC